MAHTDNAIIKQIITEKGWAAGTHLENRVALRLSLFHFVPVNPHATYKQSDDVVYQQYRVGPYRLDFAWPPLKIALEADGWYHQSPDGAMKDARRDMELRHRDWFVFRVHDSDDVELAMQLSRVAQIIRGFIPR